MTTEAWLTFPKAAALIGGRLFCGAGKAEAKVREALASGEVRCSYTVAAVVNQESAAHQDLTQAAEREASARHFKLSGSAIDILRSRAQRETYRRAIERLALKPDINDPSFRADLASLKIQINTADLLDWLTGSSTEKPPKQTGAGHKSKLANDAARAIWGAKGPPPNIPPQDVFKRVADRVQQQHGVRIAKSQVLRSLGLKKA
jgi:hypothetical protein